MKKHSVILIFLVLFLGISGMITISVGGRFTLVWQQLLRLSAGMLLMCFISLLDFERIKKAVPFLCSVSVVLLYALLFFGVKLNGMRGWFRFHGLNFQPSEPGKAFFLAGMVWLMYSKKVRNSSDIVKILWCGSYTAVWLAALLLQPDMGTSAVYAATFIIMLYLSNIKLRCIFSLLAAGATAAAALIMLHPYALRRITGFLHPEQDILGRNWHLNQLLRAVARGSWFGVKSNNAVWSRSYLPFAYNDSAYAAICETIGAVGAAFIPAAFLAAGLILVKTAEKNKLPDDRKLFVAGAAFMLIFQSFLHISVNLGIFPVTGITLVFVSYGGSSMISGSILLGLALSALNYQQTDVSKGNINI